MKVFIDGKRLLAQLTGQPPVEIFAQSATTFFMTVVDATLDFDVGPGAATTATLRQGGQELVFSRAK